MNIYKFLFIFLFVVFFSTSRAADYQWINAGNGSYDDMNNWSPSAVPNSSDNIIFNDGNEHIISNFPMSVGDITIIDNTEITIETSSINTINCKNIYIDNGSTFIINQLDALNIKFESGDIYGNVILENAAHSFGYKNDGGDTGFINFNSGSSFTTKTTTDSATSPLFGDAPEKIIFMDGASYFHEGGESPFKDDDYCVFNEGSNYYILDDTNSNHIFAGKSYGNIIVGNNEESFIDINVSETNSGTFSFYNLTTENGDFYYDDSSVQILIYNDLSANSGEINLNCSDFKFISNTSVSGTDNIEISTYSTSDFSFLDSNNYLTLNNNLTLNSYSDFSCDGEIDFTTYSINVTSNNINFSNTAKLITANVDGIYGSFIYGIGYTTSTETTIEYNSNVAFQNIGLPDGYIVGKLIVNNPQNVKMQYDLIVDSLFLNQGNLQIESNNLIIQKNIDYNGGHLFGGITSDLSFVDYVKGVTLDQDLTLNTLTIDGSETEVLLDSGNETILNYLNINIGSLNLNNNSLKVNNEINLNGGELYIEAGTLKVDGILTIASEAMLIGGTDSNLEFLSNAENANLTINELASLLIETSKEIILKTDLTIQNLLSIENGIFSITDNELILIGNFQGGGYLSGDVNSNLIIEGEPQDIDITFLENSELNSLQVNRSNSIINIINPITINSDLELLNGRIKITNELTFDTYCNLLYNTTSYIEIDDGGFVTKYIYDSDDFEFPIGTENGFAPVTISPNASEVFNVSVSEGVFENGYDGSTFTDDRIVNLSWNIESSSSNYNLKLNWYNEVVGTEFEQNNSYVSFFNTSTNSWEKITSATTNNNVNEIKVDEISQTGKFYVSSIYNMAPIIENQTFEILEHSTVGTVVGQIEATDPDFNNIYFSIQETGENTEVFNFDENGQITVKNSEMLEFSNQAVYKYIVTVCDDGEPVECSDADITINVTEFNIDNFYITNYISPNGDGVNDTWVINGANDAVYKVEIYDKSGNLVYKNENYKNDWDGTNYGTPLPSSVYYYHLTTLIADTQSNYKGTITIVR